jgi:hypothetical protein
MIRDVQGLALLVHAQCRLHRRAVDRIGAAVADAAADHEHLALDGVAHKLLAGVDCQTGLRALHAAWPSGVSAKANVLLRSN